MFAKTIGSLLFLLFIQFSIPDIENNLAQSYLVSSREISLEERYEDSFVNNVFKDNILLNLAYLRKEVAKKENIDWKKIKKPFNYKFDLEVNKTFAFHEDVLPQYKNPVSVTTNSHFNFQEGFKSDGYLAGDGVCHLASLIYWVAKEAGLEAYAPTNHDFAVIPEIAREYGVSIYNMPGNPNSNALQNLYVTNNTLSPITFQFSFDGQILRFSIYSSGEITI